MISKESDELHHSIGSLIDGAHPGLKTDRDYLGRCCPKTFETAKGKRERKKHGTNFLSFPPYAVMKLRFFRNHKHTQQLSSPINNNHLH